MDVQDILVVRDAKGMPRIVLSAHEYAPRIVIAGRDRSELVLEMDGHGSRIRFRRADGVDAVVIASSETSTSVVAFDGSGKPICEMEVDSKDLSGSLSVLDASGNVTKVQKTSFA